MTLYPDEGRDGFIAEYADLSRLDTPGGTVLYPASVASVVDSLRSSYPSSHPLYAANEMGIDDRVMLRVRLPSVPDVEYLVVRTDGLSADPGFYLLRESAPHEGSVEWGEVLALPLSGAIRMYQRTNSTFARRKDLRIEDHAFVEIPQERYQIGLRTTVLDTLGLFSSVEDQTIIATASPGDTVDVLDSAGERRDGRMLFRLRDAAGRIVWAWVLDDQCPTAQLRGICYLGD